MNNTNLFFKRKLRQICSGTGLIALDVVINNHNKNEPYFMAGGSCGNVLIILSYLGWDAFPIGRLKRGNFSEFILKDMKRWGVNTSFLKYDEKASTPVIIEKVRQNGNGDLTHTFSFYCPTCDSFLPRYRPITIKQIDSFFYKIPQSDVCYIDRVSSGALDYAKKSKKNGSIIFFEPTKINGDNQFREILEISDILKYSNDITISDKKIIEQCSIPLIIETRGSLGLTFNLIDESGIKRKWKNMKAFPITDSVDTAGSGDWCSAGIIHILKMGNVQKIDQLDEKIVKKALRFGQALAGLNCKFYGARGSMYALSKSKFQQSIIEILNKENCIINQNILKTEKPKRKAGYCPICNEKIKIKNS